MVRLNKFIANSGICSRREADNLITAGAVKVNGIVVTELGTKINIRDKVQIGEQTLKPEKLQYVLLNKPKGYITTTDDPEKRNTVMILVEKHAKSEFILLDASIVILPGFFFLPTMAIWRKSLLTPPQSYRKTLPCLFEQIAHTK